MPRHEYGLDLPVAGEWEEIVDTDSRFYGGSDVGNGGSVTAVPTDRGAHARVVLPPLGVLWLAPRTESR
jgi:1,4-alpha-glucan branching enzyme